jgi:hypothetical protein
MLKLNRAKVEQLADDIRNAHNAIDDAVANTATLVNSVLDVARSSQVPPATSQPIIENAVAGLNRIVEGRKGFVAAHAGIAQAQRDSDLAETDFGCLGEGPLTRPSGLRVVNG